ncbi:hypothetical protein [Streptosporangium sp. NPDC051022]|uniref:hypothetical protein n=1 Tax=Streptosporangium sp. NPDC051022 TaxID=3155752 RepID=UPI0034458A29
MSINRLFLIAAIAVVGTAGTFVPVSAAPDGPAGERPAVAVGAGEVPQKVVDIVNRINRNSFAHAGKRLSDEDRATLVNKYPQWADRIVDPDQQTPLRHESLEPARGNAARSTYCKTHDRYIDYYSVTGSKIVEWHHRLYYCVSDEKVGGVERNTYIKNQSGGWEKGGFTINSGVGNKTTWYGSAFEERIRQCMIVIPCVSWAYPYSEFVVNGRTKHVDHYWRRG